MPLAASTSSMQRSHCSTRLSGCARSKMCGVLKLLVLKMWHWVGVATARCP